MSKDAFLVLFVSIGRLSEGFSNLIEVILGNCFCMPSKLEPKQSRIGIAKIVVLWYPPKRIKK